MISRRIKVRGTVQGVGFRPFIYRLAHELGLNGYVRNTPDGVEIHIEGKSGLEEFKKRLLSDKPPLSEITDLIDEEENPIGASGFQIKGSSPGESTVFAPPDIFTCNECREELFSPSDRRHMYPFINCTNCGPRYTIISSLPYDRKNTTMSSFNLCKRCKEEYENPLDRRFHAEPNACPECGPRVSLIESGEKKEGGIERAVKGVKQGKIVALKGIGGFHLICDARNISAVRRLRRIKQRKTRPFALMARDLESVREVAEMSSDEEGILKSPRRPIVLLKKKAELNEISPFLDTYGIMLPYTPLHHLFMRALSLVVATSANEMESPILKNENEGIEKICDIIVTHDRDIAMRCDDSVMRVVDSSPLFIRRARGYVPEPMPAPDFLRSSIQAIALGGELKNTISIYKDGFIITSQYLGDLKDYRNFRYFTEIIEHYKKLYSLIPDLVISDVHPDFISTRYGEEMGIRHLKIQHHFSHVLASMIENKVGPDETILGVSLDGVGLGTDKGIWGGEFLLCSYKDFKRIGWFRPVPQPGGDLAAKKPWRMQLSYLMDAFGEDMPRIGLLERAKEEDIKGVMNMIRRGVNSPLTSSCGRLFDAVSSILGVSPEDVEFEGEPPMRLEAIAEDVEDSYGFSTSKNGDGVVLDFSEAIKGIVKDAGSLDKGLISGKFHNTIVEAIKEISVMAGKVFGIKKVALCGGCFLNSILLVKAKKRLEEIGFSVIRPTRYSPNDESLSLGQIAYGLNVSGHTGKDH